VGPDVFISHSSRDRSDAQALCRALAGRGVRCWMAPRDIPAGSTRLDTILAAGRFAQEFTP
jgi:hypothetical protein